VEVEPVLFDERGMMMNTFRRKGSVLRLAALFAAALILAGCNHQSAKDGPKTTHEEPGKENGNGGGGGGY
jgi:outer membrane PBP1 activator LpoA protein